MPPPRLPLSPARLLRRYATATPGPSTSPAFQVFNRETKRLQRDRAASNVEASRTVDYLRETVADRLVDRLLVNSPTSYMHIVLTTPELINRRFPRVLDLGAGACHIARQLTVPRPGTTEGSTEFASSQIDELVATEISPKLLYRDQDEPWNQQLSLTREVADEEALPYASSSFDAVLSAGSMHWINDLPAALLSANRVLKSDAPLVAAMFGGDTLFELRTSLQLAETERLGGVSPRVSPLADTKDVGGLLDRAGFKLLTVDVDDVVVDFPDIFALMTDLAAMGESNAVTARMEGPISRDVLAAAQGIYKELHGNEDGTLPATFRIIYMIGWKQSENQPKPLKRGSGQVNMKDILEGGGKKE